VASKARATGTDLASAYEHCAHIAKTHYENFTVGSWFLPRSVRPYLFAVYAFCRHTDDQGDEAQGDRLSLLDAWEKELDRAYTGAPTHPIMVALQDTIRRFDIPDEPFRKLIEANRMDQRQCQFPTYADLLFYCEHSANPVGRMVLYVLGYRDQERQALSDVTCTALQLANFWQDVRRDGEMGRIYIPVKDMERFGYSEGDLADGIVDDRFRALMRFEVDRAEDLFIQGLPLAKTLKGRARLDIALFSEGGMSVLKAIRRQDYDVLSHRPAVSSTRKLWLMLSTVARLTLIRKM
jgi:squalene synthase HpnC